MAKGDVVSCAVGAGSGAFRPAAGIEWIVTALTATGPGETWNLSDGTYTSPIIPASTSMITNAKIAITNVLWLTYTYVATYKGLMTAVQVK